MSINVIPRISQYCLPESDFAVYDEFVDSSPQGILYCHTWWLDAVAPGRYQILPIRKGNTLRAAWPIVFSERKDALCITMPSLTQKLGILLPPSTENYSEKLSEEHRLIGDLVAMIPDTVILDQRFHENFTNWLPFYWAGYQQTTRYTYVFDNLKDLDALWANIRKSERRAILKAMKHSIVVRETEDLEYLYAINRTSFDRQGIGIPYSLELLRRIDTAVRKNAGRKILVAEDTRGRAHACTYLVYDDRCAIQLVGGADPSLRSSGAGPLLDWESIRFAAQVSSRFDFEGSMIRGVECYFRGLGAMQMPYFRIWNETRQNAAGRSDSRLRQVGGQALRRIAQIIDPINIEAPREIGEGPV